MSPAPEPAVERFTTSVPALVLLDPMVLAREKPVSDWISIRPAPVVVLRPSTPEPRADGAVATTVPPETEMPPVKMFAPDSVSVPAPVFASASVPPAEPLPRMPPRMVSPEPAMVSVWVAAAPAVPVMPFRTESRFVELLVHDWLPPSTTATWPGVAAWPIVTAPAAASTVIPPVPIVRVLSAGVASVPPTSVEAVVARNSSESADWLPSSSTVCGVAMPVMPKTTSSRMPGMVVGLGVVAVPSVLHEVVADQGSPSPFQ